MRVARTSTQCVVATFDNMSHAQMAFHLLEQQMPGLRTAIVNQPRQVRTLLARRLPRVDESLPGLRRGAFAGAGVGLVLGGILVAMFIVANISTIAPYFILIGLMGAGIVVGALIGAMSGWDVPAPLLDHYQQQVLAGEVLLVANGRPDELAGAQTMLETTHPDSIEMHATTSDDHAGESRQPFES